MKRLNLDSDTSVGKPWTKWIEWAQFELFPVFTVKKWWYSKKAREKQSERKWGVYLLITTSI
jgi:hypothetical protein